MNNKETYNNTGIALFVFNDVEFFLNCIITHYIKPNNVDFFMTTVLNTSVVNFATKIKILINLDVFTKEEIKYIREFSKLRNVFAHSNREHVPEIEVASDFKFNVYLQDLISIPNSEGRVVQLEYKDFIIKFNKVKDKVINVIYDHIKLKNINTFQIIPSNLLNFLEK